MPPLTVSTDYLLPMLFFVGGSGGSLAAILEQADLMLCVGGRLVITAVTVETIYDTLQTLDKKPAYSVEASGVQITRLRRVGAKHMFQALNPVYIITCIKGEIYDR